MNILEMAMAAKMAGGGSGGNAEVVAGVQSDWSQNDPEALDYVKDRTHYTYRDAVIVVDPANISGGDSVDTSALGGPGTAYKVSDYPLTEDDINNGELYFTNPSGETESIALWPLGGVDGEFKIYAEMSSSFGLAACYKSGLLASGALNVPSVGTYFLIMEGFPSGFDKAVFKTVEKVVPIEDKYIPDTITREKQIEDYVQKIYAKALKGHYHSAWLTNGGGYGSDYQFTDSHLIVDVKLPNLRSVADDMFKNCANLQTFDGQSVTSVGTAGLRDCVKLSLVKIPNVEILYGYAFEGCGSLEKFWGTSKLKEIKYNVFENCVKLAHFALQNTEVVCTLQNVNSFERTPIANGTGFIYVPAALVESYKTAKNWSTYADQFRALEDYTVDGTVTGELDWEKV